MTSLTKAGTLLRDRIAVRTFREWDDVRPGFIEVDTVVHCGPTVTGFHLWTVTAVDVATGWVSAGGVLACVLACRLDAYAFGRAAG